MALSVGGAFLIWVIVLVIAWLLIAYASHHMGMSSFNGVQIAFLAFLIAAVALFIAMAFTDYNNLSSEDKAWANILMFVAYVIPLLLALWLVFVPNWYEVPKSKMVLACDSDEGTCKPLTAHMKQGGTEIRAFFPGNIASVPQQ